MQVFTILYIFKHNPTPYNSIYKIGMTRDKETLARRAIKVRSTLNNDSLTIRWYGRFLGAYFVEQLLHIIFAHKNVQMPVTVSGYTEFFDLNWFNVRVLIFFLEVYQIVFYNAVIIGIYYFIQYLLYNYT